MAATERSSKPKQKVFYAVDHLGSRIPLAVEKNTEVSDFLAFE